MKHALVLDDSCYIDRDFSLSLLGKMKEFSSLSNLKMVLDTEGFTDITIKYMGGVWVLISFQSIMAKENFLSHVGAGSWFSTIQQASDSFHADERVAWIDIEGVPIMAGSTNTFTNITSKWGDLLYEDDKEDSCFHRKRVCIKTKLVENIFEWFKIIVKGFIPNNTTKANSNHDLPSNINSGETQSYRRMLYQIKQTINQKRMEKFLPVLAIFRKQQHLDHKVLFCNLWKSCEVYTKDERFGSIFNIQGAAIFNSFISSSGLVDVPMGGCSFTWVHKSAAKMSKLDRFLISEGLMESCPNISAITLDRYLSDHRPILLHELCFDYGPTPFGFYHYRLIDIDKTIDAGYANSDLINNHKNVITSLLDMEKLKSLEVAQKAKIKWSIEGVENSKFFHDEFLSHFKNRFDCPSSTRLSFDMNFPNQISSEVQVDLEKDVSLKELKRAV
nr:RNA-directed DNA polymerase, eukaryota, reverse transcriptase zinc-binding domain protein [Tanacetum cinerariifolium]